MKNTMQIKGRLYLSSPMMAEHLGISTVSLWRWSKKGTLPPAIKVGNRTYYDVLQIEEALTQQKATVAGVGSRAPRALATNE
jgi:predicted DNA-binding transcriptional regulator AlpA